MRKSFDSNAPCLFGDRSEQSFFYGHTGADLQLGRDVGTHGVAQGTRKIKRTRAIVAMSGRK